MPVRRSAASKAAQRTQVADRRRSVALMARNGVMQSAIASALGVSEATVSDDLAALRAAWRAEAIEDVSAVLAEELAALDGDEASLRATLAGLTDAVDRVRVHMALLRVMERRSALLGLDEAARSRKRASGGAVDVEGLMRALGWLG